MANLSEMGFPWHLSIICCPHASFHSCKYHFYRAHVGGADLFYNLNFEYDSFTECAAFLIREGKAPSCFISQHQRIWISLWSGGSALKRQPVLLIVHCWRNCNLVWKLHTGPHHRISQLILPYTTLRIDIFSQRAELFTVTVICLFLHRWRLPITLRLRCLAQMEMSNKLCLVVGLLHFTAQLYYFKSGVENKSTCQGIMLFLFSRWILEEKVCCRYKKKEITILNSASITSQVLQEWQKCKLLWIVSAIFWYSYSFIASWASLVLQLLCPQRNLDAIFRLPPYVQRFGSNMKARGWAPGPFAVWQMVDYPNKRTNYLGFPSAPGHCWEQREGPATRPANSGSAGTEGRSHSSSVSLPGVFIFPPLSLSLPFFTVYSRSILSPTWQSQHKHILEGFCFNTVLLLC